MPEGDKLGSATSPEAPAVEAHEVAEEAGLRYVDDSYPGVRRRRSGKGFSYRGTNDRVISDAKERERIRRLAVPPAWRDVWICPHPKGHIQATGRDQRGRKQYRYHPRWREVRDENKFGRMVAFGKALPGIRRQVDKDMARRGLPREKVLATVVRLLETTLIRVGNDEYRRENRSFGLTTLRDRHADIGATTLEFEFRGKGGKVQAIKLRDRRLARIVKACQDLPGQELFQYVDDEGARQTVDSADVNDYLRAIGGEDFTAKDFRTWAGTVLAALALQEFEEFDSDAAARRNITQAVERVASMLGNTPTICRNCYIHPEVLDAYLDGSLLKILKQRVEQGLREELRGLTSEEAVVLAFLQRRLSQEVQAREIPP